MKTFNPITRFQAARQNNKFNLINSYYFTRSLFVLILLCLFHTPSYAQGTQAITDYFNSISDDTNAVINISGYLNAHYMKHDGMPKFANRDLNQTITELREATLFLDLAIHDGLLFSSELELSYDFSSDDVSGRTNSFDSNLTYYYMDFDLNVLSDFDSDDYGQYNIRFGRILVPFLQYNENKPNFKQSLMSQPFTAWQLAPVNQTPTEPHDIGWTDFGAMLDWSKELNTGIFNAKFAIINGLGNKGAVLDSTSATFSTGPTVRTRDGLHNGRSDWDDNGDVNNKLAYTTKLSYLFYSVPLNIGVSHYQGAWNSAGDKNLGMFGMHLEYLETDWHIKAENVTAKVQQTAGVNPVTLAGPSAINTSTGDYNMAAFYIEGGYNIYRYGQNRAKYVKFIARYDIVDTNDQAVFTPFHRKRNTLGLEWAFVKNIRLRYENQQSTLIDYDKAPAPYVAAGGKQTIDMTMVSIILYF